MFLPMTTVLRLARRRSRVNIADMSGVKDEKVVQAEIDEVLRMCCEHILINEGFSRDWFGEFDNKPDWQVVTQEHAFGKTMEVSWWPQTKDIRLLLGDGEEKRVWFKNAPQYPLNVARYDSTVKASPREQAVREHDTYEAAGYDTKAGAWVYEKKEERK